MQQQLPRLEEGTLHRGTQKRGAIKTLVVVIPPHNRAVDVQPSASRDTAAEPPIARQNNSATEETYSGNKPIHSPS